jgi:hypothetical protein
MSGSSDLQQEVRMWSRAGAEEVVELCHQYTRTDFGTLGRGPSETAREYSCLVSVSRRYEHGHSGFVVVGRKGRE